MRLRPFAWSALVMVALGAAAGAGLAWQRTERAAAHIANQSGHIVPYSFNSSRCTGWVDPITVIFHRQATTTNVNTHAQHHNGWGSSGFSSAQYFYDHGCKRPTGDIANAGPFAAERYHMRHVSNRDPSRGTYSLGTPDHERLVRCNDGSTKHAVDATVTDESGNVLEWGGFVRAKWYVVESWTNWDNYPPGPHDWTASEYWNNKAALWQCNGTWASNDGWIDFVEIR